MRKALNCIIMGAPGGGKGTISKKLVKDFGFIHVSKRMQSVASLGS
jgi:adenylate kinase family enzyme